LVTISLLTPEELSKGLASLESSVNEFVSQVINRDDYDVIVAVERRGLAMIFSPYEERPELLKNVQIRAIRLNLRENTAEVDPKEIQGRRLLVFDDLSNSGRTLSAAIDATTRFSSDIRLAIFTISKEVSNKVEGGKYEGYPIVFSRIIESNEELSRFEEVLINYYERLCYPSDVSGIYKCGSIYPPLTADYRRKLTQNADVSPEMDPFKLYLTKHLNKSKIDMWVKVYVRRDGSFRAFGDFSKFPRQLCRKCSLTRRCNKANAVRECNRGLSSMLENQLINTVARLAKENGSHVKFLSSDPLLEKISSAIKNRIKISTD